MISRDIIIEKLKDALEPLPYFYAFWLEGADATHTVDRYSDLDFWVDVEDDFEQHSYIAIEKILSEIARIDYKYIEPQGHPKLRQRVYHLAGTGEYLLIDFNWQLHSRAKDEYFYIKDSSVENALVLFDKVNIIRFLEDNPLKYKAWNDARLGESKYRYTQHARVTKYILRKQYLESYTYYNRYVLEPLINVLRILYTPAYASLHLLHISRHLPETELNMLEYFAKIPTLEDMARKIPEAEKWFSELIGRLGE
jgi:hypothetical protein